MGSKENLREVFNEVPPPPPCLYGMAMGLRGAADGSAEGCLTREEAVEIRDYLRKRLASWGPSRTPSEMTFCVFLSLCIQEAEENAPWLFREVP